MPLNHNINKGTKVLDKKTFRSELKKILGFRPRKTGLYEVAFIHRSATVDFHGSNANNERLEYLGDAILDAVLSEYLFRHYPLASEGELTKLRSRLANRNILNNIALSMSVDKLIISYVNNNCQSTNIYGDALEALIGALFIDKGYDKTRKFITRHILNDYIDLKKIISTETDYKSQLFQWAQKMQKQISFNYNEYYNFTTKNYVFKTVLKIDHDVYAEGSGQSKKEAEQQASLIALKKINKDSSLI